MIPDHEIKSLVQEVMDQEPEPFAPFVTEEDIRRLVSELLTLEGKEVADA